VIEIARSASRCSILAALIQPPGDRHRRIALVKRFIHRSPSLPVLLP
jgi:hypothetical protein